jgi:hypothetical protein
LAVRSHGPREGGAGQVAGGDAPDDKLAAEAAVTAPDRAQQKGQGKSKSRGRGRGKRKSKNRSSSRSKSRSKSRSRSKRNTSSKARKAINKAPQVQKAKGISATTGAAAGGAEAGAAAIHAMLCDLVKGQPDKAEALFNKLDQAGNGTLTQSQFDRFARKMSRAKAVAWRMQTAGRQRPGERRATRRRWVAQCGT